MDPLPLVTYLEPRGPLPSGRPLMSWGGSPVVPKLTAPFPAARTADHSRLKCPPLERVADTLLSHVFISNPYSLS